MDCLHCFRKLISCNAIFFESEMEFSTAFLNYNSLELQGRFIVRPSKGYDSKGGIAVVVKGVRLPIQPDKLISINAIV